MTSLVGKIRRALTSSGDMATLVRQMGAGAAGPLLSFVILFALPLTGAVMLSDEQFAMWSLLSTVSTIALSIDFGGVALTMARIQLEPRGPLLRRAIGLSMVGSGLIGAVALVVWVPYSTSSAAAAFSFVEGACAIVVATLGAALRSAILVLAQVALNDHRFALRTWMVAGQSVGTAVIAFAMLLATRTAWALPLGWALSSAVVLLVAVPVCSRAGLFRTPPDVVASNGSASGIHATFAWSRTLVSVMSGLLQQADRWIVGALGGPALLAAYEVVWRFASLPRFLVQNLAVVLGGNAVASLGDDPDRTTSLLRHSNRIAAVATAVCALGSAAVYVVWVNVFDSTALPVVMVAVLVSQCVLAMSAPLSYITIAVGMPKLDIPYVALSVLLAGTAAAVGAVTGRAEVFAVGNAMALLVGVVVYFVYAPKALVRRLERGTAGRWG